jgi:predicted metalloprotease with PDZ domain
LASIPTCSTSPARRAERQCAAERGGASWNPSLEEVSVKLHYEIAMPKPHRHLFDVTFTAEGPFAETVEVRMPVWTPGSYLVREYARNVQDLEVTSLAGAPLEVRKLTKSAWRVDGASGGFRFRFKLYANEMSVQSPHLDDTHGFIHPPAVCPYVDGYLDEPCEVTVVPAPGWRVATGLEPVAKAKNRFRAADYDELADSPIECGDFAEEAFTIRRRKHRIVVSGGGEYDLQQLVRDTKRIVAEELAFWGRAPYEHYTFICHVYPGTRGGLEHRNSTVLGIDSFGFHPRKKYEDEVLGLIAHEFFHTWNVKRIRPAVLGPFDYSQETYTRLLWVFEGVTSYYDALLVRRAGLMTPKRYLRHLAEQIGRLMQTPGRLHQSLAESSFDTWIKFYRQNEHSPNSLVSYYLKGELVALLLDLHLRSRTGGRVSLDDVMREMWRRYEDDPRGIDEDEFERIAADVSGLNLNRFFRRAVDSTAELDFGAALKPFGLRLATKTKDAEGEDAEGPTPWIGIETVTRDGLLTVKHVYEDSPADHAGVNAGDVLVALDGYRVTAEKLKARLKVLTPGRRVEVALFRRDRLRSVELEVAKRYEMDDAIEPVDGATKGALALRDGWLGGSLDDGAST